MKSKIQNQIKIDTSRKTMIALAVILGVSVQAQVIIGGEGDVSNNSVSLEFANDENRGLILPYVENKSGITEEGTIIYDATDFTVKYLKEGTEWISLGGDDGTPDTIGFADLSLQDEETEELTAKTSIGTPTSVDGILVLEDSNKAMVLPKVASPHENIINPAPGMMVYDIDVHQLAIYNGTSWSFWEP